MRERLDEYEVTQFGANSQRMLEKKKLLDRNETRRAVEKTKWAWLSPTILDLALFAEALGCHDERAVEAFLSNYGFAARQPTSKLEQAGARLFQEYRLKEFDNGKVLALVIRSPNEGFFAKNPADRVRGKMLIWLTLNSKAASPYKLSSKEYWIDCGKPALKIQSDYWDDRLKGFTLPGGDTRWGGFDREPLARTAQQVLCAAIR